MQSRTQPLHAIGEPTLVRNRMAAGRIRQLRLLLWKNWLFSIRSWKSTLLQLLAPCFFILLIALLSLLPQQFKNVTDPIATEIGVLPRCHAWNKQNCTSLKVFGVNVSDLSPETLFSPLSNETIDCVEGIMKNFSNETGLVYGRDIELHLHLSAYSFQAEYLQMASVINQTQAALVFFECNKAGPPRLNYTILYNSTRLLMLKQLILGADNGKPDGRAEIQVMVDSIYMRHFLGKDVWLNVSAASFPHIFQQQSIESKQASSATLFLFCAATFQFIVMLYNVVSEKDLKLRQGLKLIGLKDSVYWWSWSITGLIIAFLSTLILLASGFACFLQFFHNTDPSISFLLFFLYSGSMVPLAFFVSVFISTARLAVTVGMVILVVGVLVVSFLANPFLLVELYRYLEPLVYALFTLPPFHLAKAMADIGSAASDTDANGLPQTPYRYTWAHMFQKRKVLILNFGDSSESFSTFYMPATYESFVLIVADAVVYGLLAWYLDAVLRGNHGIPRKLYFFLQPSYWFDWFGRSRSKRKLGVMVSEEGEGSEGESTGLLAGGKEYGTVSNDALQITNLTKVFKSGVCCCKRALPAAVDSLCLEVRQSEILVLLGHNGAGKSTTINMLTGLLEPTQGDAKFYGLSIQRDMDAIRGTMGVCPQHDILWSDLTAWEHMELFAGLKEMPRDSIKEEIQELLENVRLNHVANKRVKTFSGGMKRRLSVALSFLGDPKIMFLDEPTTGMDPKIRRDIWNLILQKKHKCVTIMTTHTMDEADLLGDRIAIMSEGRIKAKGTSVSLKNTYAGYTVELVVKQDSVAPMTRLVAQHLPDAVMTGDPVDIEGGGVLLPYSLPPDRNGQIVPFFRALEGDPGLEGMLSDYSISQTTLEEVFLNVTVGDLFQDEQYQPILMRSGSLSRKRHTQN